MNESATSGNAEFETVRTSELEEITVRRDRVFSRAESDPTDPNAPEDRKHPESLIGLALSGGGVRSAAFSLGILQGLHRHQVLRFIDYLSTVSGGGYAGAFLSSAALRAESTSSRGEESEDMFPIADNDGRQTERMLKFIHGGRYLRKTWIFINRYLIGLLLIWLVVISGLMAAASLVTLLFRLLDTPAGMDWTTALGFKGDVLRTLFPSFILFLMWLLSWGISYFKFGRRAAGQTALIIFRLLVVSLLVAIAALLGTGDISFSGGSSSEGFSATFKTIIFGAIMAGLLPYLTPQRLIRSGTNPKNAAEKYVFWMTTRVLAYGVPFLFVAFFARENISHYNDYREDRLVRSDLQSWDPSAPIWAHLVGSEQEFSSGNIWSGGTGLQVPQGEFNNDSFILKAAVNDGPENARYLWRELAKLSTNELTQLSTLLTEKSEQGVAPNDNQKQTFSKFLPTMVAFEIQQRWASALAAAELDSDRLRQKPSGIGGQKSKLAQPKQYAAASWPNRWCHFVIYLIERTLGDNSAASGNLFHEIVQARRGRRDAQQETVAAMNRELANPQFFATFLPAEVFGDFEDRSVTDATITKTYEKDVSPEGRLPGSRFRGFEPTPTSPQVLKLSEKLRIDGVSPQAAAAFERVAEFHPNGTPETWLARLQSLRRQAASIASPIPPPDEAASTADGIVEEKQAVLERDAEVRAIYTVNRQLLQAYYGNLIEDRSVVYASVVLGFDQWIRWKWFVGSLLVFLFACALVDLNATSWHGFYSQRIASMWIERTPGLAKGLPLAQLETTDVGRPYHLLTGAVHIRRMHDGADYTTKRERFLFSKLYCGSPSTGYTETGQYMDGECTLEDAVAISGAAVSPVQTDNPLIIRLLFLLNIRLGQWVPNPGGTARLSPIFERFARLAPFTPLRFLYNRLRPLERRAFCFVTDGGHYENLGVEALLKRRCTLIIAADAGHDPDFVFADLTRLIRKAKQEDGISFVPLGREDMPLDLEKLVPDPETRLSRGQFLVFKIRYPEEHAPCGYLVYIKPTLTGDEPFELRQFHRIQEHFPHDPTSDQFYDADRFDAYRALGLHIVGELCGSMAGRPLDKLNSRKFIEQLVRSCGFREELAGQVETGVDRVTAAAVRDILAELRSPDKAKHELARQKLHQLGPASFVAMPDLLDALLDEEHWYVPHTIRSLLYEDPDHPRDALPQLVEVLKGADEAAWNLQVAAARVLGEYGRGNYQDLDLSSAIPPLIRLCHESQRVAVRVAAVKALAAVGQGVPAAAQALEACARDPSKKVQAACKG